MSKKVCEALVVSCIDFRIQEAINTWVGGNLPPQSFDRVAFAGGVRNFKIILNQIEISKQLHNIKAVILINHEDCGAYGKEGTRQKHVEDLKKATKKVTNLYPDLIVTSFYLHLDGKFDKIKL